MDSFLRITVLAKDDSLDFFYMYFTDRVVRSGTGEGEELHPRLAVGDPQPLQGELEGGAVLQHCYLSLHSSCACLQSGSAAPVQH